MNACAVCPRTFATPNALGQRGDLVREACHACGATPAEAHYHQGYAREHWLDVEWLCDQHHSDAHHPKAAVLRRQIA